MSGSNAESPPPSNILEEFEASYMNIFGPLVKEDPLRQVDIASLKANADINTTNIMESSKNLMNFFLQKKLLLMHQKPEYVLAEEIQELKQDLARKSELVKKHKENLVAWKQDLDAIFSNESLADPSAPAMDSCPGVAVDITSIDQQSMVGPMNPSLSGGIPPRTLVPPNLMGMSPQARTMSPSVSQNQEN